MKYSFEITPEMVRMPIRFVCQSCGMDSSDTVNQIIRQQFSAPDSVPAASSTPAPSIRVTVVSPPAVPTPTPASLAPAPPVGSGALRVASHGTAASSAGATAAADAPQPCFKHGGQLTVGYCLICQKPICPQCMAIFGYVCSALCKGKAEDQGIDLPVYENKKSVAEARQWRKTGAIAGAIVAVVAAVVGVWVWYEWFGSVPSPKFSVRFPEAAYAGQSRLVAQNQLVFLHGGVLARYDIKSKKEIWSRVLVDRKQVAMEATREVEQRLAEREKAIKGGADPADWYVPMLPDVLKQRQRRAESSVELHTRGENVWVAFRDKLVRFDWATGQPGKEIPLDDSYRRIVPRGGELLLTTRTETGGQTITHLSLASGETRVEEVPGPEMPSELADNNSTAKPAILSATNRLAAATTAKGGASQVATVSRRTTGPAGATTTARPGQSATQPLDPATIAARAQNLALPERLALPATISARANQQRLEAELNDALPQALKAAVSKRTSEEYSLLPDGNGFVYFGVKLLEEKSVAREAMKAPPKKSALDGTVNAAATVAVANEILNEIQRNRGGDTVIEDVSRYQVTFQRPGEKEVIWTGEVVGPPQAFPLPSGYVVTAGKSLLVLDKSGKKRWESQLNYPVAKGFGDNGSDETLSLGQGPCVERGQTLYVFDQGVLTAFDFATGNARWRRPTVGVAGLFFDDQGMIYANSTSASHESLKYSRQIDISQKTRDVVHKLDPATGKALWQADAEGLVNYVSGEFIYTLQSYAGDEEDDDGLKDLMPPGVVIPPHVRIKRLDPDNGRVMWEHYQRRAPLDIQFDKNVIQILFRKEVQVLKFLAL